MGFDEPADRPPTYVFQADPKRPEAVFLHTPQQEPPIRFVHDAVVSLLFSTFAGAAGALVGMFLGVVTLLLGFGHMVFLLLVFGCAVGAGGALFVLLVVQDHHMWRRVYWMRRYPGDLIERASARAFAHWIGTLTTEELEGGPLRGDARWKVHPHGLTLVSMSIHDVEEDLPHDPLARTFARVAELPADLRERSWSDLGAEASRAAQLQGLGRHLATMPPAVCMTDGLRLATAHQRMPVLGALLRQGQTQP
jgi:hypothetical protein